MKARWNDLRAIALAWIAGGAAILLAPPGWSALEYLLLAFVVALVVGEVSYRLGRRG